MKTIAFDLGGVLLTDGTTSAFDALETQLGIHSEKSRSFWFEQVRIPIEKGQIEESVLWGELTRMGVGLSPAQVKDVFLSEFRPIPYGIEALQAAHAAGYRTALASSHVTTWLDRWRDQYEWFGLLDPIVCSDAIGAKKPEPVFYQALLDILGEPPLVFFDDLAENVDAAREMGIPAELAAGPWWPPDEAEDA